jgi:hypothetical protein
MFEYAYPCPSALCFQRGFNGTGKVLPRNGLRRSEGGLVNFLPWRPWSVAGQKESLCAGTVRSPEHGSDIVQAADVVQKPYDGSAGNCADILPGDTQGGDFVMSKLSDVAHGVSIQIYGSEESVQKDLPIEPFLAIFNTLMNVPL